MSIPPLVPQVSIEAIKAPKLPQLSARVKRLTEEEKHLYEVHTRGLEQDIQERKDYAKKIYKLTLGWFIGLALVLVLHGWRDVTHFDLSERIILALITSTTIEVIGVFVIVAKYLFPSVARKR